MTEHEKYMKAALKLAKKSADEGEVPVGCVIVCDGEIVGRGRNRRESKKTALSHAELEAIAKACKKLGGWRLQRCDMYVTLEPCPMCAGAIINSRIKTVYYGADDDKAGACGSVLNLFEAGFNHKPQTVRGLLQDDCRTVLQDFFKALRERQKQAKMIRKQANRDSLRRIPGVGDDMEQHLNSVGIEKIPDLIGTSPDVLYQTDCAQRGKQIDRCVLYVYRLAVYFAEHANPEPEKLRWWYWKRHNYPENE